MGEIHDLRRQYFTLSKRDNPPPRTGRRPIVQVPSAAAERQATRIGLQSHSGRPEEIGGYVSKPEDEPIELQAYAYRVIHDAIASFLRPGGERALRETWLTKVLPGPARYAAHDDGDSALVWAELHDLRRLLIALSKRDNPPPRIGRRPIVQVPSAAVKSLATRTGLQPFAG